VSSHNGQELNSNLGTNEGYINDITAEQHHAKRHVFREGSQLGLELARRSLV
jgi:hypothetical protein